MSASYVTVFTIPCVTLAFLLFPPTVRFNLCASRISSVLISRFLLHLQAASQKAVHGGFSESIPATAEQDSLVFARVIGSLGEHIDPENFITQVDGGEEEEQEQEGGEMMGTAALATEDIGTTSSVDCNVGSDHGNLYGAGGIETV